MTGERPSTPTVDRIEVATYTIPTDAPEADGTLSWDSTTVVVVDVYGGGERGLGWTYASAAAGRVVSELLEPAVCGQPVFDVAQANERMSRAVRNAGRPGVAATAISAVDIALWDLKGRLLNLPISGLLGSMRTTVPIYGSGGFTTYDEEQTARQVEHWLEDCGTSMVKIKIGESWGERADRDLERVAQVRELIGDRDLFVDANGGYDVGQAIRVGTALNGFGVTWFEEPVSSDDLDGLRMVRIALSADIAAGEYGYDGPYFRRMIDAQAVDCLQIDVTRCGGITEFIRAAALAAAANLEVSAHCAPHLHASFGSAVPNLRHVEYFHDHERIEERLLVDGTHAPVDGTLAPSDLPGHGYQLRRKDAERWRVE